MTKVCIINGNKQYENMMESFGFTVVSDLFSPDFVQFCGGEDVHPSFYGEDKHPYTASNRNRDIFEMEVFNTCVNDGIPMAGICRGAQFLHVMNGGPLWQHVDGHAIVGTHGAVDVDSGKHYQVTSTHHQMMRDFDKEFKTLLVSDRATVKQHMNEGNILDCISIELWGDLEAVFHEKTKSLCFQPHPEYKGEEVDECRNLYYSYLKDYVLS